MNMRVVVFVLLAGTAGYLLLIQQDDSPAAPVRLEQVHLPTASTDTTDTTSGPLRTEAELPSGVKEPNGVGPQTDLHREMLERAVHTGVLPRKPVTLKDDAAWDRLFSIWQELSRQVDDANAARFRIAQSTAQSRFAKGEYETIEVPESARGADGGFAGRWSEMQHPDDIMSNKYKYRPGGGQIIQHIRFSPGTSPEVDEATMNLRLMELLRRDAVADFLQRNAVTKETDK